MQPGGDKSRPTPLRLPGSGWGFSNLPAALIHQTGLSGRPADDHHLEWSLRREMHREALWKK